MLPKLPVKLQKKRIETPAFYGINYSENTREGELRDTYGMTNDFFPCLSTRKGRAIVEKEAGIPWDNVSDVFAWFEHLCVVSNGKIYLDGEEIAEAGANKHQFCVISERLIIAPEMLEIDLRTKEVFFMNVGYNIISSTVSGSNLTVGVQGAKINKDGFDYSKYWSHKWVETYETAHFENGEWVVTGARIDNLYDIATYSGTTDRVAIEAVDIDRTVFTHRGLYVADSLEKPESIEYEKNTDGVILKNIKSHARLGNCEWERYYAADGKTQSIDDTFKIGEGETGAFEIKNTEGHYLEGTYYYDSYSAGTFHLTSALEIPTAYFKYAFEAGKNYGYSNVVGTKSFTPTEDIPERMYVYRTTGGAKYIVFDPDKKEVIKEYEGEGSSAEIVVDEEDFSLENAVLSRRFPDLDYICAWKNRLCGVSNEDKTIYISSLGIPRDFYSMEGDGGAYAVAVGSNGKFTGIAVDGTNSLCAFKANSIVKVYGDYPSNYYTNEHQGYGVKDGAHLSIIDVNRTLFYRGEFGIYAYNGNTPQLISSALANKRFEGGIGGTDGENYYLSVQEGEASALYVYDTQRGLWLKRDDIGADGFCIVDGKRYIATLGKLYEYGLDNDEAFDWMFETVPFTESTFGKKGYTKMLFRADMSVGSNMTVEVKEDDKPWKEVFVTAAPQKLTFAVPIHIGRCDKYAIRVSGRGKVMFRDLAREFRIGSEEK